MTTNVSYADAFRDVTLSAKQLIKSEVELIKFEIKDVAQNVSAQIVQAIFAGALIIVSAVPLLASATIALGNYWDGNYALSALVVGLACALVGGLVGYRAYSQLKKVDVSLPSTQAALTDSSQTVQRKAEQMSVAMSGGAL